MVDIYGTSNLALAATLGVTSAASFMTWRWIAAQSESESNPAVEGYLKCHCGEVRGKFCAPCNSTATASCHCNDCLGFVHWAVQEKHCKKNVRDMINYRSVHVFYMHGYLNLSNRC